MKYLAVLFFLFISSVLYAQNKKYKLLTGKYMTYFGTAIEIKSDSTFKYYWYFDQMSSWSRGTWTIKNDTIFFKTILVYDTLRRKNNNGKIVDSLVLANAEKPKLIAEFKESDPDSFAWVKQNSSPSPDKLFYKNEKLFAITKKGKLFKKKIKAFWTGKMRRPWYFKQTPKPETK